MNKTLALLLVTPCTQEMSEPRDVASKRASLDGCAARTLNAPSSAVHFHHVHFNTTDPQAEIAFFEKYYGAQPIDFCERADATTTRASKTERAYLLYTKVPTPPDATPNT